MIWYWLKAPLADADGSPDADLIDMLLQCELDVGSAVCMASSLETGTGRKGGQHEKSARG
jgi:hypothetical protein